MQKKNFSYATLDVPSRSSGKSVRDVAYYRHLNKIQYCSTGQEPGNTPQNCTQELCEYNVLFSSSVIGLFVFAGSSVLYENVLESAADDMRTGVTGHQYIVQPDAAGQVILGEAIVGAPLSNFSVFYNGRERVTSYYKKEGNALKLIKRQSYAYKISDSLYNEYTGCLVNRTTDPCLESFTGTPAPGEFDPYEAIKYYIFSPWVITDSVTEDLLTGNPGDTLRNTVKYEYANTITQLPSKVITRNSKGQQEEILNYYPNNRNSVPGISAMQVAILDSMQRRSILSPLVYQQKNLNGAFNSAYRAEYKIWPGSDLILPQHVKQYYKNGEEGKAFYF